MDITSQTSAYFLDQVEHTLRAGNVAHAMEALFDGLWWLRKTAPAEEWEAFIVETAGQHSLRQLLQEDPLTARACGQPRGYPGDAELLDYIYFGERNGFSKGMTPRGRQIFRHLYYEAACRAVRARMRIVAKKIDEVAHRTPGRVLSVACGHVREASHASAFTEGCLTRFVALDQDADTLQQVDQELGEFGVTTLREDIKNLILREVPLGQFDLIYSTGLYDYLSEKAAKRLTQRLFALLAPGGTLLIANVLPDIHACGYMEAFMNWRLTFRTPEEMGRLLALLDPQAYRVRTFLEPNGNIIFLELCRLGSPVQAAKLHRREPVSPGRMDPLEPALRRLQARYFAGGAGWCAT